MAIFFNGNSKEFHLQNSKISYIIKILKNNQLGQIYYGKRINHRNSFEHLFKIKRRVLTSCLYEGDLEYSLELIKQEYPSYGTSDYREPAFQVKQRNGSKVTDFQYKFHNIYEGKPKLEGLPAVYVEDNKEAETLEVVLEDKLINSQLILYYTIFEDCPVITRSAKFINNGPEDLTLLRAMSMCCDLPDSNFEMLQLSGAWARERYIKTRKLETGIQSISSTRGSSSANHNPFIALKRPETNEYLGEVYGFSLVYSGNFLAQVEVDYDNVSRVTMGINPFDFSWALKTGESFQTPEVVMVYSDKGLNDMSQTYHRLYRNRLARGKWRNERRPVLINSWEATYFNFDEEKIVNTAKASYELGIELFVLDDGWFGKRDDDTTSLGDWYPDKRKLPDGIKGVAEKINSFGMKFGLWFEPEMISKESELYKSHPDWVIKTKGRRQCHGRNQYVLDFSNKEVVDYIYEVMSKMLRDAPISYVKWDCNRNLSEIYSRAYPPERQGEIAHRYILGVYSLYERLIDEFPYILFESCASGGGRFDPGMLYYAPQAWTSDDTDAVERLKIQYGSSMVYPLSSMGSHVAASPNHQVGRTVPMHTRANVAYFGTFGYEIDLNTLTEKEKLEVKKDIKFYKQYSKLINDGFFYRLRSPFEGDGNIVSWMVVSDDKKEALLAIYNILSKPNDGYYRILLKGLNPQFKYSIFGCDDIFFGDELMNVGFIFDQDSLKNNPNERVGDFMSRVFVIRADK